MSYSERITEVKDEIDALVTYANETTGESDTKIGDAVGHLVDGYGGGSSYAGLFPNAKKVFETDITVESDYTSGSGTIATIQTGLTSDDVPSDAIVLAKITLTETSSSDIYCMMSALEYIILDTKYVGAQTGNSMVLLGNFVDGECTTKVTFFGWTGVQITAGRNYLSSITVGYRVNGSNVSSGKYHIELFYLGVTSKDDMFYAL